MNLMNKILNIKITYELMWRAGWEKMKIFCGNYLYHSIGCIYSDFIHAQKEFVRDLNRIFSCGK